MKRKPEVNRPKYRYRLERVWPAFRWYLCELCSYEFRRESGWRIYPGPFQRSINGVMHIGRCRYLCRECVADREQAKKIALRYAEEARNKRHPTPPPTGTGVQK